MSRDAIIQSHAEDINRVWSNDYDQYQRMCRWANEVKSHYEFVSVLEEFYESIVWAALHSEPSTLTTQTLSELVGYMPREVFDYIADWFEEGHDIGWCDACGEKYERSSREDHCGDCGMCWADHTCDGVRPSVVAMALERLIAEGDAS